jgi:hypothetical protein
MARSIRVGVAFLTLALCVNISRGQFRFVPRVPAPRVIPMPRITPTPIPRFTPTPMPSPSLPGNSGQNRFPSLTPSTNREASDKNGAEQKPTSAGGAKTDADQSHFWTWVCVIGAFAITAIVLGLIARMRQKENQVVRIRIINTPPGDAPEEIRQAWVGLELPLAPGEHGPRAMDTAGVVSQLPAGVRMGYAVEGRVAVDLLASHAPAAAAWWRTHTPEVLASTYWLVFPAETCEKVA